MSSPSGSVGLSLFQTAHLVSTSSRHYDWTENGPWKACQLIYAWRGRGLKNLISFRSFLKPLSCLPSELDKLP